MGLRIYYNNFLAYEFKVYRAALYKEIEDEPYTSFKIF